jgi:hypothetical protein
MGRLDVPILHPVVVMSKCEFVYETPPGPFFDYAPQRATLRCKTHDCTMMLRVVSGEVTACLVGYLEQLEARVAQLERPQSNIPTDELGNPFSLRKPVD